MLVLHEKCKTDRFGSTSTPQKEKHFVKQARQKVGCSCEKLAPVAEHQVSSQDRSRTRETSHIWEKQVALVKFSRSVSPTHTPTHQNQFIQLTPFHKQLCAATLVAVTRLKTTRRLWSVQGRGEPGTVLMMQGAKEMVPHLWHPNSKYSFKESKTTFIPEVTKHPLISIVCWCKCPCSELIKADAKLEFWKRIWQIETN